MSIVLALCALAAWTATAAPVDPHSPEANSAPFEQTIEEAAPAASPPAEITPTAPAATTAAASAEMADILNAVGAEMDKAEGAAAEKAQEPAKDAEKPAPGLGSLLRGVYALIIVLVLIIAAYALLARLRRHAPMLGGGEFASVVGRLHLDTRFALHFVRVGDKVLLLGVTAQNINILEAFDAATFNLEHTTATPTVESQHDFMEHLRASSHALNPMAPGGADDEEIVSLRGDIERLKRYLEEGPRVDPEH
jgi:flagellar biosynthetic protein FliO